MSATVTGSISDQLNAVTIQLRGYASLAEAEYRYPRWIRVLESAVGRVVTVRHRGGSLPGVREAIDWLDATTREGFWAFPVAESLRSEVARCVGGNCGEVVDSGELHAPV